MKNLFLTLFILPALLSVCESQMTPAVPTRFNSQDKYLLEPINTNTFKQIDKDDETSIDECIIIASAKENCSWIFPGQDSATIKKYIQHMLSDSTNSLWAIEENQKIVATALISAEWAPNKITLNFIAVDPNKKHHGLGTQLLTKVLQKFYQPNKIIFLSVDNKNIPANKLYEKTGFKKVQDLAGKMTIYQYNGQ